MLDIVKELLSLLGVEANEEFFIKDINTNIISNNKYRINEKGTVQRLYNNDWVVSAFYIRKLIEGKPFKIHKIDN